MLLRSQSLAQFVTGKAIVIDPYIHARISFVSWKKGGLDPLLSYGILAACRENWFALLALFDKLFSLTFIKCIN